LSKLPRQQLNDLLSKEPSLKPALKEYTQQNREAQSNRTTSTNTAAATTTKQDSNTSGNNAISTDNA
jgi:hypothetical protein